LALLEHRYHMADARPSLRQDVQYLQAHRVSERLERIGLTNTGSRRIRLLYSLL
jgi:hypothetical protein